MKTYAIPKDVCDAELADALSARYDRGDTYKPSANEDYLRIWHTGDFQVHVRAAVRFSTMTIGFHDALEHDDFVQRFGLISTPVALERLRVASGVDLLEATNTAAILVALNPDDSAGADGLWTTLFGHEHPAVVANALRTAPMLQPSESLIEGMNALVDHPLLGALAAEMLALVQATPEPTYPPTQDVDRLLSDQPAKPR